MRGFIVGAVLTAATLLSAPIAQAQSPELLGPGPKECPPDVRNPPRASNDRPLSEQLSESKGVICPPAAVDPEIVQRPAPTGDNPVIPAPRSPGGDPTVRPKG
jgi:hypothetical protein